MEEEKVKVRRAKRREFKEILKIEQEEIYPELTIDQLENWTEGEGRFEAQCFISLFKGKVIGFAIFEIYEIRGTEIIIQLDAIAIKKEYQGMGFGSKLLTTSLDEAKKHWDSQGFKTVCLMVETGIDEAGGFYEKVFHNFNFQKTTIKDVWSDGEGIIHYFIHLKY